MNFHCNKCNKRCSLDVYSDVRKFVKPKRCPFNIFKTTLWSGPDIPCLHADVCKMIKYCVGSECHAYLSSKELEEE